MMPTLETAHRPSPLLVSVSMALLLMVALAPAGLSAADPLGANKPFHLKAIVDDETHSADQGAKDGPGMGLSRSQDLKDAPMAVLPLQGNVEDMANISNILPPPVTDDEMNAPLAIPSENYNPMADRQNAATPPQAPEDEGGMNEYGVDWRTWVSKLADKWFFVLKKMEDRSGLNFHTVRPALIHFTCTASGQIGNVYIKQSSGIPMYDQMQIQALLQCVPLHSFPKGTKRSTYTLVQGWESHPRQPGEQDFKPGSFGGNTPMEIVKEWVKWR